MRRALPMSNDRVELNQAARRRCSGGAIENG
jgi:hypothetical protein